MKNELQKVNIFTHSIYARKRKRKWIDRNFFFAQLETLLENRSNFNIVLVNYFNIYSRVLIH